YYWFPKMFGRMMSERLGQIHFWTTFIGVYAIFIPFHLLGLAGHPRRYADTLWYEFLRPLNALHVIATYAALLTSAAQLIFLFNLFRSMFKGAAAGNNPWQATTLEWSTPANELPVVYRDPYEYSVPKAPKDFLMQAEKTEETSQ